MHATDVLYTRKTVAGLTCNYNSGVVVRYSTAASLLRPLSSALSEMSRASYWRENSGKTQKPPKKDPLATLRAPRFIVDRAWTSMDAAVSPLPAYPDVVPQQRPTRTTTRSSTRGVIGYPILVFYFVLLFCFFDVAGAMSEWDLRSAKLIVISYICTE